MTALLECLTALLEYLDLLQCLKITVLGHVHLSACNINNSPHKLGFQFSMRAGDQKLRFDLVWPKLNGTLSMTNIGRKKSTTGSTNIIKP